MLLIVTVIEQRHRISIGKLLFSVLKEASGGWAATPSRRRDRPRDESPTGSKATLGKRYYIVATLYQINVRVNV